MGCRKWGREHWGSRGRGQAGGRSGPELDPCHPLHEEGAQPLPLWSMEQDERLEPMDAEPERSPRQVRVLTLPIRAASSADRGPKSAGQCLRLPWTELGAAEARLRVEGSRRRRLNSSPT